MEWLYLFIAAIFEAGWAIGMKYTHGLTKPVPTVFTVIAMLLSFVFLSLATKRLPIGTAYAIWTGIGVVGTTVAGVTLFREPATVARFVCIALILAGVVGLKVFSADAP